MNFSYFRTNKQLSMSWPTRSRSHSNLWKIKGMSKGLVFKEREGEGGPPRAWRQGLYPARAARRGSRGRVAGGPRCPEAQAPRDDSRR